MPGSRCGGWKYDQHRRQHHDRQVDVEHVDEFGQERALDRAAPLRVDGRACGGKSRQPVRRWSRQQLPGFRVVNRFPNSPFVSKTIVWSLPLRVGDRGTNTLRSARSGVASCQRRYADCEDQNSSFEDRLKVRGRAENGEPVESDCEDEHADEGADDMKLAFA